MISSKHFTKITVVIISIVLALCLLAMIFADSLSEMFTGTDYNIEYETELFDTDNIIDIDIRIDEDKWNEMLENAMAETYYECDVNINGNSFYRVGIRPKGNTSLSSVANDPDNNRYSFKLEFDQFVDGQNCWGLDKLALNNSYADATNMKEAIIYDMYRYLDADAPLYNYAKVSVNGEYWGVYLALEAVEESFMVRNYGKENGHLYKPDGMNMGNREDNDFKMPEFSQEEMENFRNNMRRFSDEVQQQDGNTGVQTTPESGNAQNPEQNRQDKPMGRGGFGGGGMSGNNGSNLNYSDDQLDSYSAIWEGDVTDSSDNDHRKVVTALRNIHESTDLEQYLDIESSLKYMVVHSFAVNEDSLSGNMAHNYYLYEGDGKLNVIPWDYNLSFGGMNGRDATAMVNDPIDTPFSATEFFDALLENEEYKARYHEYYEILIDEYVFGGKFNETFKRIRSQIDELTKTDPNSQYTYEEYDTAAKMLYETVKLRGKSVKGQLDGTIPSTDEGQQTDSSALIDASSIDISVMGEFMGGGPGGSRGGMQQNPEQQINPEAPQTDQTTQETEQREHVNSDKSNEPSKGMFGNFAVREETPINYTAILISAGILLVAIFLLCFVKRRH